VNVRYIKRAAQQIAEALDHIGEQSAARRCAILRRILEIVALLQLHPYAGRSTGRLGVRRVATVPYPYLIDYRVTDDTVLVLRFRHGARKPH